MHHDFATFVVRMHTPEAGAVEKYETKNWDGSRVTGLLKRKSPSPETITENEDQAMDQNNGLVAKIFREHTQTTLTIVLREIPHSLSEFFQTKQRLREQQ